MLEKETAQVTYLLARIKSAQCQTKISSLKKLLSELQKILCGSGPLRRPVIKKEVLRVQGNFCISLCQFKYNYPPEESLFPSKEKTNQTKSQTQKTQTHPLSIINPEQIRGFPPKLQMSAHSLLA